jgi:hypothetical protein
VEFGRPGSNLANVAGLQYRLTTLYFVPYYNSVPLSESTMMCVSQNVESQKKEEHEEEVIERLSVGMALR